MTLILARAERFFFEPATATPLAVLRILVCMILLIQAGLLAPDFWELYGDQGIVQGTLKDYILGPLTPQLGWFHHFFRLFGVGANRSDVIVFCTYVGSLLVLMLGFETRLFSIASWFLHFVLMYGSGSISSYGVDSMAHMVLFYFIFMPVGDAISLDRHWHQKPTSPKEWNRLSLRVLQIHLCGLYLITGLAKAQGIQWWNGEAVWRATMLPQFANMDMSWLAFYPTLGKIAAVGTLVIEIGYVVMVWPRRTRLPWIILTVLLHIGIFLVLGLKTFSLFMIAMNIALFIVPSGKNILHLLSVIFPIQLSLKGKKR